MPVPDDVDFFLEADDGTDDDESDASLCSHEGALGVGLDGVNFDVHACDAHPHAADWVDLPAFPSDASEEVRDISPAQQQHQKPALRSRWSSSTLSSVREEPSTPSKLRLYFGSRQSKAAARASTSSTTTTIRGKPQGGAIPAPLSSASFFSAPAPPSAWSPPSARSRRGASPWRESTVMVIGPEARERTVRQSRSSSSTGSECGSVESGGSAGGLARKPIPVEMFSRSV
jgi:hypothetical protein